MNETQNLLVTELKKLSIDLPVSTVNKLLHYVDLLLNANKTTNLTAITDYQEALFKHIYDSLMIINCPAYSKAERILDVGSGAGLPSIPLAICSSEKQFISLDSIQKKIRFQEQACQTLEINNLRPVWARAEDFIQTRKEREQFDLAIARAVSSLNVLTEITIPFIKIHGCVMFYKGKDYQNELQAAQRAIMIMGGKVDSIIATELPLGYGTRSLITIRKTQPSPLQYPRKAGVPQKKPL
jgi:16S rRNA (guanine527-N7)-methyltransferase